LQSDEDVCDFFQLVRLRIDLSNSGWLAPGTKSIRRALATQSALASVPLAPFPATAPVFNFVEGHCRLRLPVKEQKTGVNGCLWENLQMSEVYKVTDISAFTKSCRVSWPYADERICSGKCSQDPSALRNCKPRSMKQT